MIMWVNISYIGSIMYNQLAETSMKSIYIKTTIIIWECKDDKHYLAFKLSSFSILKASYLGHDPCVLVMKYKQSYVGCPWSLIM